MRSNVRPGLWNLPTPKGRCRTRCGLGDLRDGRRATDHRCVLMDQEHGPEACVFAGKCLRAVHVIRDLPAPPVLA